MKKTCPLPKTPPIGQESASLGHGSTEQMNLPPLKFLRALAAPVVRASTRPLFVDAEPLSSLADRLKARGVRPVIPLAKASGYRFTKIGPGGDSPHQLASTVYLQTGSRAAVGEFLTSFLETHRPKSLAEMLFSSDDPSLYPLTGLHPLTRFQPWDPLIERTAGFLGQSEIGQVIPDRITKKAERQIAVLESLQRYGYRPEAYRGGYITGYFVVHEGDYAFIVRNGMHRLGVLAALGTTEIAVRLSKDRPSLIDASGVSNWAHVRSGFCSHDLALRMIRRHFGQPQRG